MRCPGPTRLSYRGHQLLRPGEIRDARGRQSCIPPALCQATRPRPPRPQPSRLGLLESGLRRGGGLRQSGELWKQSPQKLNLGPAI